ncbi:MAG: hypothetical protein AAFQ60_18310, partial [Pseudomonadota bacterium]
SSSIIKARRTSFKRKVTSLDFQDGRDHFGRITGVLKLRYRGGGSIRTGFVLTLIEYSGPLA